MEKPPNPTDTLCHKGIMPFEVFPNFRQNAFGHDYFVKYTIVQLVYYCTTDFNYAPVIRGKYSKDSYWKIIGFQSIVLNQTKNHLNV